MASWTPFTKTTPSGFSPRLSSPILYLPVWTEEASGQGFMEEFNKDQVGISFRKHHAPPFPFLTNTQKECMTHPSTVVDPVQWLHLTGPMGEDRDHD